MKKIEKIPNHIVIIPDGNRRWAKEKGFNIIIGYNKAGSYENIESLIKEAKELGVKYLTIWGFSTENWQRDSSEIKAIFNLISNGIKKFTEKAHINKIKFKHLGRKDRLPKKLILALRELEEKTKNYNEFNIQLCLDYGGRDEIIRAVNQVLNSNTKEINEENFKQFLDTENTPDPDLIIRTSGENRLSGILPFQSAYAELYFTKIHFPDFNAKELKKAIQEYSRRRRRFGN